MRDNGNSRDLSSSPTSQFAAHLDFRQPDCILVKYNNATVANEVTFKKLFTSPSVRQVRVVICISLDLYTLVEAGCSWLLGRSEVTKA